ncbi:MULTISPECIES: hypothetical protein [unclassified Bartonella]|uniref:hypothetical protein n=1 Tax=unclassified Bartonella TaxID=2645622 RepID=UPI0035D0318C
MSDAERFIGNGLISSFATMLDFYVSGVMLGGVLKGIFLIQGCWLNWCCTFEVFAL